MSPERRQRVPFVTVVLCLVAASLLVVAGPLVAWTIWIVGVAFCAAMICVHNRPGDPGQS